MKRGELWVVCVVLLVGVGVLAVKTGAAEEARAKCSVATLKGMYLFANNGFQIREEDHVPFAVAGYDVYDGNGKVNSVLSVNLNGEITQNVRSSGTYTVNEDCTGTLTFPDPIQQFDLFVAPDGSQYALIQTDPPELVSASIDIRGTAKRVGD
jgi:hypothetical protein